MGVTNYSINCLSSYASCRWLGQFIFKCEEDEVVPTSDNMYNVLVSPKMVATAVFDSSIITRVLKNICVRT